MKITTWNVNGYRAISKKGFQEWVSKNQPDVLCLQETKVNKQQLSEELQELPGYSSSWHSAQRPGYSGVASFHARKPLSISLGLGIEQFDREGRVIWYAFEDFELFNVYFPNGSRGQERMDFKLNFYRELLDLCKLEIDSGRNVIITGDFNTAHREIDLANPKENSMNSGFLPIEREWVQRYLDNGFVDAFRLLYPERVQYTWWTYRLNARQRNIGWRLDYFLISSGLVDMLEDVVTHDDALGSDHCPVTLILKDNE